MRDDTPSRMNLGKDSTMSSGAVQSDSALSHAVTSSSGVRPRERIGYVVRVYPRFSETFVVSEIIARERAGERIDIFALRPTSDTHFQPELARVAAPVRYVPRAGRTSVLWDVLRSFAERPGNPLALAESLPDLLGAPVDDAIQAVHLARRCQELGITRLHAHFAELATTVARLAARLCSIPYTFTAHAKDIFHDGLDPVVLERNIAGTDVAVTISDYNARFLASRYPLLADRIRVVRNGIELGRFPFDAPQPVGARPIRLLAVGRLVEKKGFALLLDAAAELRRRGVELELRLAGGGELAGALRAGITRLGIADVTRMLGPVPQDEVARLLSWADAFVAPCVVGADGNVDGLPTVLLEAMARGVVCIASDVTGIPELIIDGRTGVLVPSGDRGRLVAAIEGLLEPGFPWDAIAASARAAVERDHSSERQASRLAQLTTAATVIRRGPDEGGA